MSEQIKCFLCNNTENVSFGTNVFDCSICGKYQPTMEFLTLYHNEDGSLLPDDLRLKIRYIVKKNNIEQEKKIIGRQSIILTQEKVKNIDKEVTIPKLLDKIELFLDYLEHKTTFISEEINIETDTLFPLFFCKNNYELYKIILNLEDKKFINTNYKTSREYKQSFQVDSEGVNEYKYNYYYDLRYIATNCYQIKFFKYRHFSISLTSEGLKHQSEKQRNHLNSKLCFVAMWFNDKEDELKPNMEDIYRDYIKPAVDNTDLKFEADKINDIQHVNDINDEIITRIRRSRFVVADFTGDRGGVYFEAGFALGLGIPVIFTCHKNWFNGFVKPKCNNCENEAEKKQERVHFDLAHRNFLLWTDNENDEEYNKYNLDEFKKNLTARINAIIV